jgi:arginase
MVNAHLLALPDTVAEVALDPPLDPAQLVFAGLRRDQCTAAELATIGRLGLAVIGQDEVAADPAGAAARALALLAGADRILVHVDIDVVDFIDVPLSENPGRNVGLPLDTVLALLSAVLPDPAVSALTVTEVNPDHGDPDGSDLARLAAGLAAALAGSPAA